MEIISHFQFHEETLYERRFSNETDSWGYGFPCDENGKLIEKEMNPTAYGNFLKCINGEMEGLTDRGIFSWVHRWKEYAVGRCVCGEKVTLDGFTNTCPKCERDYNQSGQELAPRSQWGEETGESLADILRIP